MEKMGENKLESIFFRNIQAEYHEKASWNRSIFGNFAATFGKNKWMIVNQTTKDRYYCSTDL